MNPYIQYMYSYPHKTAYGPLSGVFLKEYANLLSGPGQGLYFHVPFCQAKCGYCNLFSVAGASPEAADRYLDAVERQCAQYREVLAPFQAVFSELVVGGGTPLFFTESQLERMFFLIKEHFEMTRTADIVIETAPNQTTAEKLAILKQAGVTRVSMGIQSFLDEELSTLKRHHTAEAAERALKLLKSFAFPCVNVDFIYGIPGQTEDSLRSSLKKAVSFSPDEIFLYPLYVKHGAGLEHAGVVPDAQAAVMQYRSAARFLKEAGFRQDSMRRFVRTKEKRRFSECGFGSSLALGCGGRSYLGNLHFCSPYAETGSECFRRLHEFERTKDFTEITNGIFLSEEEEKRRYIIRHLLIYPGLSLLRYRARFQSEAADDFPILAEWQDKGYLQKTTSKGGEGAAYTRKTEGGQEDFLSLTEEGLELSDYLGPQLISSEVERAMQKWEERHGRIYGFIPRQSEKL